jgi:hypothetical protein
LTASVIVTTTVAVFASGVALLFAGPGSRGSLLPIRKVALIAWIAFTSLHELAHLPTTVQALPVKHGTSAMLRYRVGGRAGRLLALIGVLSADIFLAVLVIPQFGPWLLANQLQHRLQRRLHDGHSRWPAAVEPRPC